MSIVFYHSVIHGLGFFVSQFGGGGEGRRGFTLTDIYLIHFILICNGRCSLISNLEMLFSICCSWQLPGDCFVRGMKLRVTNKCV